jgi:hypothetical protein
VQDDDSNRMAVQALLAEAESTIALTELGGVRKKSRIVEDTVAKARENYIDLVRRRRRLTMDEEEARIFQTKVERLRAALRFLGEKI